MSNAIFPKLVGESYPILKEPVFSTLTQESVNGNEIRLAQFTFPRKRWTIPYNYLSDSNGQTAAQFDIATLMGFQTARFGKWDSFLYDDPTDDVVQSSIIGTGNGVLTQYQFTRGYGSGSEPVFDLSTQGINSISIGSGGSGYNVPPQVSFSGGNGTGATGIASISGGGAVNAIFLRSAGTGYTSAPSVVFSGGGGSGASATAKLSPSVYLGGSLTTNYSVSSTGLITFNSPPGSGVQITADFAYFWRVRFDEDSVEFSNDYNGFWSCKKVVLYQTRG
jgi:hypothetical protein